MRLEWGNIPQWISGISSVVTAIIALVAFNSPVFQNSLLREENARLHFEKSNLVEDIRLFQAQIYSTTNDLRKVRWREACRDFRDFIDSDLARYFFMSDEDELMEWEAATLEQKKAASEQDSTRPSMNL